MSFISDCGRILKRQPAAPASGQTNSLYPLACTRIRWQIEEIDRRMTLTSSKSVARSFAGWLVRSIDTAAGEMEGNNLSWLLRLRSARAVRSLQDHISNYACVSVDRLVRCRAPARVSRARIQDGSFSMRSPPARSRRWHQCPDETYDSNSCTTPFPMAVVVFCEDGIVRRERRGRVVFGDVGSVLVSSGKLGITVVDGTYSQVASIYS